MTTVTGRYVKTFAEASHALPIRMHMNADYPFMLPRISKLEGDEVTITNGRESTTFTIAKLPKGERGYIAQSSTFERMFNREPTRFELWPFKDQNTPAIGSSALELAL